MTSVLAMLVLTCGADAHAGDIPEGRTCSTGVIDRIDGHFLPAPGQQLLAIQQQWPNPRHRAEVYGRIDANLVVVNGVCCGEPRSVRLLFNREVGQFALEHPDRKSVEFYRYLRTAKIDEHLE